MAVRFSPPGMDAGASVPERENLAEVVDLRSRLAHRAARPSGHGGESSVAPVTPLGAELVAPSGAESIPDVETAASADAETPRAATEDGVRLLARKARSSGELRRELVRLGHDAHEVDAAILEFEGSLYLDDLGLARVLVEKLRERKGASRVQLRVKLRERLLPDGVIEEALGELDDDEELALLRAAAADRARRLTGLDRQTAERRLLGFLARRGWSGEQASRAVREALDEADAGGVRFR